MTTRFALAALAMLATFALPAFADVTAKSPDGALELALPNGWKTLTPQGQAVKILATDGHGARLTVRTYSKDDFKDMKSLANFTAGEMKLDDAKPTSEDIQVNGKPAVRVTSSGTEANGRRISVVVTVFEADGMFVAVMGRAPASEFTKQGPVMTQLSTQIRVSAPKR